MSRTIFLDTGPLSVLTNPKLPPETARILSWAANVRRSGSRLIVPSIADYEVRRELVRAGKVTGITMLDAWNSSTPDRYLPLTDSALRLASKLWARARNAGTATADPKELDGDVLIAAQALDTGLELSDIIVAATNVGHLGQFVPAALWTDIVP